VPQLFPPAVGHLRIPTYDGDMSLPIPPDDLPFTGNTDALLATDPPALLIGFALDQPVTVQKAFFVKRAMKAEMRPRGTGR
jgi:hypothetical protein